MTAGLKTEARVVAKVIKTKLENPRKSERNIAKVVSIPKSTVHDTLVRYFGHVGQEDEKLKAIQEKDLENLMLGQTLTALEVNRRVNQAEIGAPVEIKELAGLMGDATKRRQLMTGGATENLAVGIKTYLPQKGGNKE